MNNLPIWNIFIKYFLVIFYAHSWSSVPCIALRCWTTQISRSLKKKYKGWIQSYVIPCNNVSAAVYQIYKNFYYVYNFEIKHKNMSFTWLFYRIMVWQWPSNIRFFEICRRNLFLCPHGGMDHVRFCTTLCGHSSSSCTQCYGQFYAHFS